MIILGIDPGYGRLGVAVIEKRSREELLLYSDCITTPKELDQNGRLALIGNSILEVIKIYNPDCVAIEKTFFGKNKKTAIAVSEARGIILYEASLRKIPIHEYAPAEIKIAITGYGASTKTQVAQMVKKLIEIGKEIALDDEYDAIAVALTHSATVR
jgi:crossover junction endodeoxyribonuclease RuvC